jgi:hypothetical protein
MPTDQEHFSPSQAAPASTDASAHQEEALFRALLFRVQTSSDKAHLLDRSDAALRLILNRDDDHLLRENLMLQITRLVGALPDNVSSGPGRVALVKAVQASLEILRTAEQKRVKLSGRKAVTAGMSAASYERLATEGPHHPRHPKEKASPWHVTGMVIALLVILAAGLAIGFRDRSGDQQTRPLVAQMEAAVHGNIPATNIFGGALRVAVQNGRTVVTVEGIPAGECVSSGWDLVRKGLLTVNNVTPTRVSAAKLNDICHDDDTATLVWTPKPASE